MILFDILQTITNDLDFYYLNIDKNYYVGDIALSIWYVDIKDISIAIRPILEQYHFKNPLALPLINHRGCFWISDSKKHIAYGFRAKEGKFIVFVFEIDTIKNNDLDYNTLIYGRILLKEI